MSRPEIPDKMFFRIGEVAELVGVEPHALRYWESEFRMRPQRSSSGQRMYRRRDVEKFFRIQQLVHEQGFTVQGARKALAEGRTAPTGLDTDRIAAAIARFESVQAGVRAIRSDLLAPPLADLPSSR